jgi:hypothetical protein
MIFEKTRAFDYKFKGFSTAKNVNAALRQRQGKGAGNYVKSNGIYIVIPAKRFMSNQYNPTTKMVISKAGTGKFRTTTWKRPK